MYRLFASSVLLHLRLVYLFTFNVKQGPAFIFPLNQQQPGVASRPSGGAKPPAVGTTSSAAPTSAVTSTTQAMSFSYPNMPPNETQYLAILQNNGYPFPIPTVGAPQNYRGNPAQAMPIFNGSFYSSQMIHPSQIQQMQQHHQPPSVQSAQLMQQAHQNASASSGSSSSQKHLQSQKSQSGGGVVSGGSGNAGMQNFSAQKTQQLSHTQYGQHPSRPRHHEGEPGREDSPSTTDSRGSRAAASMNIYGQNFSMPIHPQNFALMTSPAAFASAAAASATATATSASSNQNDKKAHQPQQQGMKTGSESLPPHGFAMSFGTINGANTGPGIDMSSMTQNHAMFQSSSEAAARQNIQMMATAQKKNFRISDDGKSGGDSSTGDDERKSMSGKAQSIAFTRQDLADQANSVIESSTRSLNAAAAASGGARTSRSMTTNAVNPHNIQAQIHQQQIMQLKHHQQQQQLAANAANRSKGPVTSNGSIYTEHMNSPSMYAEHMNSSSMAAKFPNSLSGFPQNLVQNNSNSPTQSPQWKSSNRAPTPQAPSSLASSTTSSLKSLPQQHNPRSQPQMHTQISFGGNQKPPTNSQGQQAPPSTNQTPSSPMMVGSPTTSKGASGSPRTTSSASTNKMSQASSFSPQPPKNSPSGPTQKSPSILGTNNGSKNQMQQQQSQQQIPKAMQQPQMFFSQHPYPQPGSTGSTTSGPSGYYMTRRRPEQHQQGPGGPVTSSGGLSLCPVTLGSTNTNDPATAIAAATANVKGGGLPSQGLIHASQFAAQSGGTLLPAGFSYLHPIPAGVQVKPAEQKQPAG